MSLILADARALPLVAESVQCVVTSPPYWGLRDYGTPGQIGLETNPHDYVAALVDVFRQVWRVLRSDGVLWLNLGDCYATGAGKVGECPGGGEQGERWKARQDFAGGHRGSRGGSSKQPHTGAAVGPMTQPNRLPIEGLKPKDLVGIPWRVAFALQADGWHLRSDVIWSKPNPMPESVEDRPTKSHEYLFLLTKSERYFYDRLAILEPYAQSTITQAVAGYEGQGTKDYAGAGVQNPSDVKRRIIEGVRAAGNKERVYGDDRGRPGSHQAHGIPWQPDGVGRNCRSVWTITTQPYAGAHFATMPEKLVERCVLAGSRPGDLVLDPFMGSGTVGRVAISLGRRAVGCDLNRSYLALADERLTVTRGLPLEMGA